MKTTILVEKTTRDILKQLGTKGQSYDNLINWLIRNESRQITERRSPKTEQKQYMDSLNNIGSEDNICDGFGCFAKAIIKIDEQVGERKKVFRLCKTCILKFPGATKCIKL